MQGYQDAFRQILSTRDCSCTADELDRLDRLVNGVSH